MDLVTSFDCHDFPAKIFKIATYVSYTWWMWMILDTQYVSGHQIMRLNVQLHYNKHPRVCYNPMHHSQKMKACLYSTNCTTRKLWRDLLNINLVLNSCRQTAFKRIPDGERCIFIFVLKRAFGSPTAVPCSSLACRHLRYHHLNNQQKPLNVLDINESRTRDLCVRGWFCFMELVNLRIIDQCQ